MPTPEAARYFFTWLDTDGAPTHSPMAEDDDGGAFWFNARFLCAICNYGAAHEVHVSYTEHVDVLPCPSCGFESEPPHIGEWDQDENGHWYERDDLPTDADDEEDGDDPRYAHA